MKFDNQTPFPAALDIGSTTEHEQLGLLSCRVTYRWDEAGALNPLPAAQMWPVTRSPEEFEGTLLMPDADYRREGIDILIFGNAVAPRDKLARELRIGVATGRFMRQYDVIGDRQWSRVSDGEPWESSVPAPFATMELDTQRSFGGSASLNGGSQPYVMNPTGRGFVLEEQSAAAVQLPNVERTEQRIGQWSDRPIPACFQKPQGGLLLDESGPYSWDEIGTDTRKLTQAVMRQSFQQAPPDFVCPRGGLGPQLLIKGFEENGLLRVALPPEVATPESGAVAYVEVGALKAVFALRIASLIVLVPERVLVVGYSTAFRYLMRPREMRRTQLRWHGDTRFVLEG